MRLVRRTLMISASLIAAGAFPAHAQAQAADEAADSGNEVIIVTAQKREQMLIDVPQSISVVSGQQLEQEGARTFGDYLNRIPGLQLNQSTPGAGRLILRGVNTGGVASTVGVYLDETPFGSSSGLVNGAVLAGDFDPFDVSRIEVLRGPQGTIYGASSLSGVLKFVTNAPELDRTVVRARGSVAAVDGGDADYSANGVVNLPVGEKVAVRATGFYRKTGGFIDSIGTGGSDIAENINDSESYGGRASLLFKPTEELSIRLTAMLQNIRVDAPTSIESDPNTVTTLYGRPTQSQFIPQFTDIDYRVYNGTIEYDFGGAMLTSSTSYATQKQTFRQDATFNLSGLINSVFRTPNELALAQNTNSEKFTQELRLSGESDLIDWLVGGYYTHEKGLIHQGYVAYTPGTLNVITTLPLLANVDINSKYEEIAGFANATLHLGEQFDIDFGGRYSHNKQTASQTAAGVLAGNVPVNTNLRSSEDVFTYSVAPKFKVSKQVSIYARVAKGFRPGGPNVVPPNAAAGTPSSYKSDSVISYEAGIKAQTADNSFAIDAAVFHIDWKDIQLLTVINNFGVNTNAGNAKIDGAEFTATFRPGPGWEISLNGAYTDARLGADTSALVGGRRGDALPFTPKYSVGLNGDYRFGLGGDTEAFLGGSLRYLSKQAGGFDATFRAANGRQRQVASYEVIDLRAGVDLGRFTVEAFARNVTNSDGRTSTGGRTANGLPVNPNGAILSGVIRPRTVGLAISAQY